MNTKSLQNVNWTSIAEIEASGEISCMDGRHEHCVVGAPGGNIGEMILILSAAEKLTKVEFTSSQLDQILANYASNFGRFFMHTDTHAIGQLIDSIQSDDILSGIAEEFDQPNSFFEQLSKLNKNQSDRLMRYLAMPQHIGCGHLKLLITDSEKYLVRQELVRQIIHSFFRLMWLGNKRMHWEMLQGEHQERQIVVIDAEQELADDSIVPYACHTESGQQFVTHSAARRFFHKRDALFIQKMMRYMAMPSPSFEQFITQIEDNAEIQMNNTLAALAKDLPVVRVIVDGNGVHRDDAA